MAPPSPTDRYLPERKLKTATSPSDPVALSPSLLPRESAQSSITGRPGAASFNLGMSQIFPYIWTAMTASSCDFFSVRSLAQRQKVSGSTSRNRGLQPVASMALKTTEQQYNGTPTVAPGANPIALIAVTMAALADRAGMHSPSPGRESVRGFERRPSTATVPAPSSPRL